MLIYERLARGLNSLLLKYYSKPCKKLTIKMKKNQINVLMIFQWMVFLPLILPIGMITGAIEGIKKTFEQASTDIFENNSVESV